MSEVSQAATDFVAAHRADASELGERLAELTDSPEAFVAELASGLEALMDRSHVATVRRVSPGVDLRLVVRKPLVSAIQAPLKQALGEASPSSALSLAQRLGQADEPSIRAFALPALDRSLYDDPERTWQQLRRLGNRAGDWSEVDSMAPLWARGVLAEPFRWAELEQLVYADRTMERRIVGATLACMPHVLPTARRPELIGTQSRQAYALIHTLIGDAEAQVQKSLSWAIREWARIDDEGTAVLLSDETAIATEHADGHRAWVIRDALSSQLDELATELRARLVSIRRDATSPSTSIAATQARAFTPVVGESDAAVAHQGDRFTRSHA